MNDFILEYFQAIHDGTAVVGRWIQLLYQHIVDGIESGDYIFDRKKADRAIRFIETFVRHNKGPLAPSVLTLALWQRAAVSLIFGIVDEDGNRTFREVFMVVGRKCGKTLFAAGVIAYEAYLDGEFGSEIYCIAPKLDQSDLVFSAWEFTMQQTPDFAKRTRKRKSDYLIPRSNTTIKKIAFNEKKADGYSPQLTVADEMSSWPAARGLRQYEVMVSGTGARNEPLTLAISSSGYVDGGIYDELFKRGTRFLLGDSREKRFLPILYTIDDLDKWDDINELRKSLPGLGISVKAQFILDQIDVAKESLSKRAEFITKYCNIKQNAVSAWLPSQTVERMCGPAINVEELCGSYAVGGIDLSQVRDLTCCLVIVEKDGRLNVIAKFFMPSKRLAEAMERDGLPYDIYVKRGLLQLSGESFIDYHDCENWFQTMVQENEIYPLKTGYDRYSASYLVQDMKNSGYHMDDVYQGENLWGVIQETEGLIEDGAVYIGDNDLLKIHLLDSAIQMSSERRRGRLVKGRTNSHIDGAAALLDAMCVRQKYASEIGEQLKN